MEGTQYLLCISIVCMYICIKLYVPYLRRCTVSDVHKASLAVTTVLVINRVKQHG